MLARGFGRGLLPGALMLACSGQSTKVPTAPVRNATLATALELQLVQEKKIEKLLSNALDRYEASGVTVAGGQLYVVFDGATAIAAVDTALSKGMLGPGNSTPSQYEAISATDDGRFYVMVETFSKDDTRGQVVALDSSTAVVSAAFTNTSFPDYNQGFEGAAWLRASGTEYLLALCANNACGDEEVDPGQGRVQLLALENGTWVTRLVLPLPSSVTFENYSDLALLDNGDGSYRAAVLSRKSSALWIGTLTTEPWMFAGPGEFYSFPLSDGDERYCSLEGITFLGPRSLALVSDSSDGGKPCNTEEESIHLFQVPP
jgi:hypothetical protein